jgi:hypothetical protein
MPANQGNGVMTSLLQIQAADPRRGVVHHDRAHHHELAHQFHVLNLRQPLVAQIWYGLNRLLEPVYQPIRRMLPDTGRLDLAPLVAFLIGVYRAA